MTLYQRAADMLQNYMVWAQRLGFKGETADVKRLIAELRAAAQPRQSLSDDEIDAILRRVGILGNFETLRAIVRETERAITGDKP